VKRETNPGGSRYRYPKLTLWSLKGRCQLLPDPRSDLWRATALFPHNSPAVVPTQILRAQPQPSGGRSSVSPPHRPRGRRLDHSDDTQKAGI
jgi:hypothetical protein